MNICHHMLTSSTQLPNRSFHVVERTRTSTKCQKMSKCVCKACKNTVFYCQICKFVGFLLPSLLWLLKLPNAASGGLQRPCVGFFAFTGFVAGAFVLRSSYVFIRCFPLLLAIVEYLFAPAPHTLSCLYHMTLVSMWVAKYSTDSSV